MKSELYGAVYYFITVYISILDIVWKCCCKIVNSSPNFLLWKCVCMPYPVP